MEIFELMLKLMIALPILLGMIVLSLKLSEKRINNFQDKKYIKVIERTQISKDMSILVVKIGKRGAVLSASKDKVDKLQEITQEEILEIEAQKEEEREKMTQKYNNIMYKGKILVKKVNLKGRSK